MGELQKRLLEIVDELEDLVQSARGEIEEVDGYSSRSRYYINAAQSNLHKAWEEIQRVRELIEPAKNETAATERGNAA